MRPAFSLLCVACAALIAAACSTQVANTAGATTRELDAQGSEVVTSSAPAWSEAERWTVAIEPEVEIGTEAGDPDSLLSNVGGAVRLDDGRIVVADGDRLALRIFDSAGQRAGSMGGRGEGPGEFGYLHGVIQCNGEIWALVLPSAFGRFDVDGRFIDLLRITVPEGGSPYAHACSSSGQHLAIGWGLRDPVLGRHRTTTRASLHGLEGELLADLGEVFGSERWTFERGSMPHPYGRQTVLALDDERAFVGASDGDEFVEYDLVGRLVRRVRWQGSSLALGVGEIDRYKEWITEVAELDPRMRLDAELARTMEYPETMPAYTAMQIDDTGHLWLRVFSPPGVNRESWEIFSPDGTWLGTVAVPLGTAVTQIGSDYLLGIHQDELGTEVVRLHRLVRPEPGL